MHTVASYMHRMRKTAAWQILPDFPTFVGKMVYDQMIRLSSFLPVELTLLKSPERARRGATGRSRLPSWLIESFDVALA